MFVWDDYLALAMELSGRNEEHCKRSAISRAYYAAYCSARAWYEQTYQPFPRTGGSSHMVVWQPFQDPIHRSDSRYAFIGTTGDNLKRRRVNADYKLPFPGDLTRELYIALKNAEDIINTLSNM